MSAAGSVARRSDIVKSALVLALGPTVALGFSRFAYALLLPAMSSNLHWSLGAAGSLGTANSAGYLLGVIITPLGIRFLGLRRVFILSMLITALALILSGLTPTYTFQLIWRLLAGVSSGLAFVSSAALATKLGHDQDASATALTIFYSGSGLGIVLSGLVIPPLLSSNGPEAWKLGWLALGAASLGATLLISLIRININAPQPVVHSTTEDRRLPVLTMALIAHFLFSAGYISYMTFVIAYLRSGGLPTFSVALVWTVLGGAAILGGRLWRVPMAKWLGGNPLAAMLVLVAVGAAVPLFSQQLGLLLISAFLFGLAMTNVPAAMTALIRNYLPSHRWERGVVVGTVVFALGQSLGPLVSGFLGDHFGLASSLWWCTSTVLLGVPFALLQPRAQRS